MKNIKKSAQSLIEYGLILALVAVIAVTILGKFGKSVTKTGDVSANAVTNSTANATKNYCVDAGLGTKFENGVCVP